MKIICVGRNYRDHAKELNNPVPSRPLLFMKPSSALLVNDKPLYYPDFTSDLHYELEIVLRISKNGKAIQEKFAHRYFDEISLGIDFTARDLQSDLKAAGHPWEIAKGFDGSAVVGDFIPKPGEGIGIEFSLEKNGERVQSGHSDQMIFSFSHLIAYMSVFFKLQMGDLIFTGTPAGVGPVQHGDLLEGYIGKKPILRCEIR